MGILSGPLDFFGLDIGSRSLRAVKLRGSGSTRTLELYGQVEVPGTAAMSDSAADKPRLISSIRQLVKTVGLTTNNVAVNLPSQRVFTTLVDMDKVPSAELNKTIQYQAESFVPTPIGQTKIDYVILGDSPKDPKKVEVLLTSAPLDYIEARLDLLESAGLNVIAMEPDTMALTRAVTTNDSHLPQLIFDIGFTGSDVVISINGAPRLARAIPSGIQSLIRATSTSLGIDAAQAEQFIFKFGLSSDKLEGKVYNAIVGIVDGLISEIERSIKFFQERYNDAKVERAIVTGGAAVMPELPAYIANRFGLNVEIGNAWRNVNIPSSNQKELEALSSHFTVAAGLAERTK